MKHGIPRTISEICELIQLKNMNRTTRMRDTYNYIKESNNGCTTLRLCYSTKSKVLKLRTEERFNNVTSFIRFETIEVDFENKQIVKKFRESFSKSEYASIMYPLITDEDIHFQQMLEYDKYYPAFKDIENFIDIKRQMEYDIKSWDENILLKKKERIKNIPDYVRYRYSKRVLK